MRAYAVPEPGAAAQFAEIDLPEPGEGEVQVAVAASSVNGIDAAVIGGYLAQFFEYRYPAVPGHDVAGIVTAVGPGVSRFSPGDEVFGLVRKAYLGDGAFATHVTVYEDCIVRRPPNLAVIEAAALGWAGMTALQSVEAIAPEPGETVLVLGASGGVGAFAVQLAAQRGATVIATGLREDADRLRSYGAQHVVDYSGDVVAQVRELAPDGVDSLISLIRVGDQGDAYASLLANGGRLATTLADFDAEGLAARGFTVTSIAMQADPQQLAGLAKLAADGKLSIPVQATYPLDDVEAALDAFSKGTHGKIVITVA